MIHTEPDLTPRLTRSVECPICNEQFEVSHIDEFPTQHLIDCGCFSEDLHADYNKAVYRCPCGWLGTEGTIAGHLLNSPPDHIAVNMILEALE